MAESEHTCESGLCDCGQKPDRVGVFADSWCEVSYDGGGQQELRLSEWRSENQAESSSLCALRESGPHIG